MGAHRHQPTWARHTRLRLPRTSSAFTYGEGSLAAAAPSAGRGGWHGKQGRASLSQRLSLSLLAPFVLLVGTVRPLPPPTTLPHIHTPCLTLRSPHADMALARRVISEWRSHDGSSPSQAWHRLDTTWSMHPAHHREPTVACTVRAGPIAGLGLALTPAQQSPLPLARRCIKHTLRLHLPAGLTATCVCVPALHWGPRCGELYHRAST